jgi:hypothetical protein
MPIKTSKKSKLTLEGSKAFVVHQAEMLANEMGMDPFEILSRFAMGDVVGLGMMTQKELDEKQQVIRVGSKVKVTRVAGKQRAWQLIPASLRFDASKELLPYLYAKKVAEASKPTKPGDGPENPQKRVVIVLPSNGRHAP